MKIFIVGGGFAGIKAAKEISRGKQFSDQVFLIDKNSYTTMLPNLPEIVSDRLTDSDITDEIRHLLPSCVTFIQENVEEINFDSSKIKTNSNEYSYDYLIFAAGSKTNFFNFNQNMDKLNILESLESAKKVKDSFLNYIENKNEATLVISGAGFTGIELACNLYDICLNKKVKLNIHLIELGKRLLPMLSEKTVAHVLEKLEILGFKIHLENSIDLFDGKNIVLKDETQLSDVFFCWCSGVQSSLRPIGTYESLPDGRIIVNEDLSLDKYPNVFIAGDCAAIKDEKQNFLRRAVNFAQTSGKHAAQNLLARSQEQSCLPFHPVDLGWIIPMYITSVGVVMGKEVIGRKGIFMHYMICGIKNYNVKNFSKEFKAAIKYTFTKP